MPYKKAPKSHGEFSGGEGVIDPQQRADRALSAHDEVLEIYATETSIPESGAVPPLLSKRGLQPENSPETADVDRKGLGK